MTFAAGAATADITPPVGTQMDGYGGRFGGSEGVHDPLFARALVLDYGDSGACTIVSCDILGMHPWIASEVRRAARETCGIPEDAVVVAATHNHAGPVGLRTGMFATLDPKLAQTTVDRISQAITAAWKSRRPSTLKVGAAIIDTISMNRRDPKWPKDSTLRVLLLDSDDGPIAALLNFACHATVLNGSNMLLSAEFPGVACRIVQEATGAVPIYLNGACGDVNPAWIEQDFKSMKRAGQIVGGQAVRTIAELRATGPGQRIHNIRWDEFPELPVGGRVIEPRLSFARREIDLQLREFSPDEDIAKQIEIAQAETDAASAESPERRAAMARRQRYDGERWAGIWSRRSSEGPTRRTEIQAIGLGDGVALLALPGEFFAETGELIRNEARLEDLVMACYANDYLGYIVPEHAYKEGGYESGVTFFPPETEGIITKTAIEMLTQLHT